MKLTLLYGFVDLGPPMFYVPAGPADMMRGLPRPIMNHLPPAANLNATPEAVDLREKLIMQIEYYFRCAHINAVFGLCFIF